jgi:hypothetical protein
VAAIDAAGANDVALRERTFIQVGQEEIVVYYCQLLSYPPSFCSLSPVWLLLLG